MGNKQVPTNKHNYKGVSMQKKSILDLLQEEKAAKYKGGLYHLTQIKLTFNSNHIEGSNLSEEQTRNIFETQTVWLSNDKVVNVNDITETINHFKCIDYVIDNAKLSLSEDIIKTLHAILKNNTNNRHNDWIVIGDYKNQINVISGQPTTHPKNVPNEIAKLLSDYNSKKDIAFLDIVEFHQKFECIHPFTDGNGRVGRLIAFFMCLKHNIIPFYIDEEIKFYYYRGLKEWNKDQNFLLDTCKRGQDKFISWCNRPKGE